MMDAGQALHHTVMHTHNSSKKYRVAFKYTAAAAEGLFIIVYNDQWLSG